MRVPRLHLDMDLVEGAELELSDDRAHYLRRVLRRRAGDPLHVFDGRGHEFEATVSVASRSLTRLALGGPVASRPESPLVIVLVQGVTRGERMDLVLQKATELGVAGILPALCERTVVRLDADKAAKRLRHWRAVVSSAAEQCGRSVVPAVAEPRSLAEVLTEVRPPGALLDPSAERSLAAMAGELATDGARFTLVVGPEGGFEDGERETVRAAGLESARLGPRVLRTETAGLVALAALQVIAGDLR